MPNLNWSSPCSLLGNTSPSTQIDLSPKFEAFNIFKQSFLFPVLCEWPSKLLPCWRGRCWVLDLGSVFLNHQWAVTVIGRCQGGRGTLPLCHDIYGEVHRAVWKSSSETAQFQRNQMKQAGSDSQTQIVSSLIRKQVTGCFPWTIYLWLHKLYWHSTVTARKLSTYIWLFRLKMFLIAYLILFSIISIQLCL